MCGNCDGIVIPIGPAGPQGVQGPIGIQGIQGIQGEQGEQGIQGIPGTNGTNGINGTNAFKAIKEYTTEGAEQTITITRAELTNCSAIPDGCIIPNIGPSYGSGVSDLHVQVWYFVADFPGYWRLLTNTTTVGLYTFDCTINFTGDITIVTGGSIGIFRIVVIA